MRATMTPCNTLDIRSSGQVLDGAVIEAVGLVNMNFLIYSVIMVLNLRAVQCSLSRENS